MLWWFAQTTLIAGGLAIVATLAGRWKRLGPEARHLLWLLVMIKLAIPPVVAWPWNIPDAWPVRVEPVAVAVAVLTPHPAPTTSFAPTVEPVASQTPASLDPLPTASLPPSPDEVLASAEAAEATAPPSPLVDPASVEPRPVIPRSIPVVAEPANSQSSIWDWRSMLLLTWLTGSMVVVVRRGSKVFRFHRALADSRPAPAWLVDQTRAIGDRVGVRPPPVVATPRVATPLLWCLGRPRLLLPETLIKRLGGDRWPGILAHELAHLARGDQWVVRLELLVEAVWWWNPLFWLARRNLHEQAEIACDARVVRALPDRRHAYAEALVDVCEHIARSANLSPALGVGGAGATHSLEGRLHMILRDPIPRRPSRRAALLAALLAALALPAWTLGQQPEAPQVKSDTPTTKPEAPPVKPDAPAAEPQAPAATPASAMVPFVTPLTIETIVAAQARSREQGGNLSFRYVVASRDLSRSPVYPNGGGLGGGLGGGFGAPGGPGGRPGGNMGAPVGQAVRPVRSMQRVQSVHVQVAEVVLGVENYRLDVLEARLAPEFIRREGVTPAQRLTWDRQFIAFNGEGYLALETAGDRTGPVPFRWLGTSGRSQTHGDSLTAAFANIGSNQSTDHDRGIDPFDPRPRNVLDLTANALPFLNLAFSHADVVGVETIDGREVVRVAWIANADIGLRGLCWLDPGMGYAVVRSDATMDPARPGYAGVPGRRTWRKRANDFTLVKQGLYLPHKVTYEELQADPAGGEPVLRLEREMTFEDYRTAPPAADAFRPKLAIQAIDDLTGNFTAQPPRLPDGLADRLTKAVAESKFGPPAVEKTTEKDKAVATTAAPATPVMPTTPTPLITTDPTTGRPVGPLTPATPRPAFGTAPGQPARIDDRFAPVEDPAKADPKIIAPPAPGSADPISTVVPKVGDPIPATTTPDRADDDAEIRRRFKLEAEVIDLARQIELMEENVRKATRLAQTTGDPAVARAQRQVNNLMSKYQQLWETKSEKLREEMKPELNRTRDEIEVLQARRDGKAAEVEKASAGRDLAAIGLASTVKLKKSNGVSDAEVSLYEAKSKVADAEVAAKAAELAEADALLNQAKRRLGILTAAKPAPDPLVRSPLSGRSRERDAEADPVGLDARDEVEFREARRESKAAEVRKSEIRLEQVKLDFDRFTKLLSRMAISQEEFHRGQTDLKLAEADLATKKADLAEADVLLNQAKRRLSNRSVTPSASGDRPATPADLRDAIEVLEAQLQGKQAELRGVETKVDSAKTLSDIRKALAAQGRITQLLAVEAETNWKAAQAELAVKKADVLEAEVKLRQAKRRLDSGQLRIEIDRARGRLNWSEDMLNKGYVSKTTNQADRLTYNNLVKQMMQIDPSYVPSPPVTPPDDASRKPVAEGNLDVKIVGERTLFPGQAIECHVVVSNPGTQPAKNVKAVVTLPRVGGKLIALIGDAKFDSKDRTLTWSIPVIEPGQRVEWIFGYSTTIPGLYKSTVYVTSGDFKGVESTTTDVKTSTNLDIQTTQTARFIDVGKTNFYDITIENKGTKEATHLRLVGKLSKNLKVLKHFNVEKGEFQFKPETGEFLFPEIERLGIGEKITLSVEVQATEPGPANCHLFLRHAEMGAEEPQIEEVISTIVKGEPDKTSADRLRYFSYFIGAFW